MAKHKPVPNPPGCVSVPDYFHGYPDRVRRDLCRQEFRPHWGCISTSVLVVCMAVGLWLSLESRGASLRFFPPVEAWVVIFAFLLFAAMSLVSAAVCFTVLFMQPERTRRRRGIPSIRGARDARILVCFSQNPQIWEPIRGRPGKALAQHCEALDRIACGLGLPQLAFYGLNDDLAPPVTPWHPPEELLDHIRRVREQVQHTQQGIVASELLADFSFLERRLAQACEKPCKVCLIVVLSNDFPIFPPESLL